MRHRSLRALTLTSALAAGAFASACGGGGSGSSSMVLVSFNLPNIAGVALNQPLVYTFSDNVDPASVTPDTIQVVGSPSFTFESIVVDGNLVAELPFIPNFDDYHDSGLAPGRQYSVFLPIFPAVDTVRSTSGHPLVKAGSFNFTTIPTFSFIEARRSLVHTPGPYSGPNQKGDEDGCINNPTNSLYAFPGIQFQSDASARLLCLANEGPPHVLNNSTNLAQSSNPFHDKRAVGNPSATAPGTLDLGAMRVRFNEPLDPVTVTPYVPSTQLSLNVQLWRVGDGDANALAIPVQVQTSAPRVVQDLTKTEVILVPSGPQPQGTYLINIQGVKDLAGNLLFTADRPNPASGGYTAIETAIVGKIAPGYRIYFRTLELPTTPNSVTESFGNNVNEHLTNLFTYSIAGSGASNLVNPITTVGPDGAGAASSSPASGGPGFVLRTTQPGQGTTANWNAAYRFLDAPTGAGRPDVKANTLLDNGVGRLKAVFAPYTGNGDDLSFNPPAMSSSTLSSDGGDFNGDGVWEFTDFTLPAGSTLNLIGSKPVLILVRGACVINGTINANGSKGNPGIDTDGTAKYTNAGVIGTPAIDSAGSGGLSVAGGGAGGHGGPGLVLPNNGDARAGGNGLNLLGEAATTGGGGAGAFGDLTGATKNQGGGGGGYGTAGVGGVNGSAGGGVSNSADFTRGLALFAPERCFQPSANLAGGTGGGGGGADDDNGTSDTGDSAMSIVVGTGRMSSGDDGGAGGGGGGGALWIIADTITVSGVIHCDGARGGNTYKPGNQVVNGGPDGIVGGANAADDFISGVVDDTLTTPALMGDGGAGGGGSGGAILLQARTSLDINSTAVLTAVGGAGGTAASANGGAGGAGRIALMTFAGGDLAAVAAPNVIAGASLTPAAGVSSASWKPTVDTTSVAVSEWINFVTNVTTISTPFWDDNFPVLTAAGLQQGAGLDFNAVVEFQGADTLSPTVVAPTQGTGLTAWSTTPPNNKIFVRWRWRFFVNRSGQGGPAPFFDQTIHPMPQILSFTIPFSK